jgi:hydrogenase maturation protease
LTVRLVVLACGNPSRGDDALGPELLARLEAERACRPDWAEVLLLTDFQLQIEHALDLFDRDLVLFVDASVSCRAPFGFHRVEPELDPSFTTHALSPAAVLHVYGRTAGAEPPPAFVLGVRGYRFELGEPLSDAARTNLEAACAFALGLCERPDPDHWARLAAAGRLPFDPIERKGGEDRDA